MTVSKTVPVLVRNGEVVEVDARVAARYRALELAAWSVGDFLKGWPSEAARMAHDRLYNLTGGSGSPFAPSGAEIGFCAADLDLLDRLITVYRRRSPVGLTDGCMADAERLRQRIANILPIFDRP